MRVESKSYVNEDEVGSGSTRLTVTIGDSEIVLDVGCYNPKNNQYPNSKSRKADGFLNYFGGFGGYYFTYSWGSSFNV